MHEGIILGNGDTICNMNYLKGIGVTHVLNTAERHVDVNPAKYPCYGIKYYGFHVDDLPEANISRWSEKYFVLFKILNLLVISDISPRRPRLSTPLCGAADWWW